MTWKQLGLWNTPNDVVQVIYGLYSAVPPSLWFNPERPLVFVFVTCLVLGLSIAAATLLKGLLSVVFGAVHTVRNGSVETHRKSPLRRTA